MTLQQLTYFLAATEHGSFSSAAESLFMAQPSLSEQIRRLEAELGVALFARGGRGLELTEAGRLFRPHAERTVAAAHEAVDSVREVQLEAGLVALPIDDRGLDLRPAMREEILAVSPDPERLQQSMTIEPL